MFDLSIPSPLITYWAFPLAETTQKLEGRKQVDEPTTQAQRGETKWEREDRRFGGGKEEI